MRVSRLVSVCLLSALVAAVPGPRVDALGVHSAAPPSFTLFESGPVRPLALSPDGSTLFAVNTPDNRLEVFRVTKKGLRHRGSVPVGLEPVAVAARSSDEAWVVNHLSDSVSVVELFPGQRQGRAPIGRVSRTLLVGDEPRDIVFAGPGRKRAFITTAHRGQNVPYNPQLTTPGIGRADVWVFDADAADATLGGTPLTILNLFTDTPRALAVSPDGQIVYAAGFHTGNRSTTIFEEVIRASGGLPPPVVPIPGGGGATIPISIHGEVQPPTSLIVQFNGTNWVDEIGRPWDSKVKLALPDKDVFIINATANPPSIGPGMFVQGVGTVLFNMAVNPASGKVYVSNTDARNLTRFEGPGFPGHATVRGRISESRITVIDGLTATPRHLNKHVDFAAPAQPVPNDVSRRSLSQPTDLAVTKDGSTLYVAAFGSSKVGVFSTAALENDTFIPEVDDQILVSGGGPGGLALDESHGRLYVLTRFDNSIAIVDTDTRTEIGKVTMNNPEPASVVNGRRFLYDAAFTSSNGTVSCATCHVFADFDSLAWDLGDPTGSTIPNPGPFRLHPSQIPSTVPVDFRPMKGPMSTQSLRGMANHGSMHWRGDRTGGNDVPASFQPDTGSFDEDAAFKKFNVAFPGLLGRHAPLTAPDLQAFTDFILQVVYPPNPVRNLDNGLTAMQQAGRDIYMGSRKTDTFFNCNGCHVLNPQGNAEFGVARPGFFGTDGQWSFEGEPQVFKIPHLRNMYQKVGMFGMPKAPFFLPENLANPTADNAFMGDQVRGFGFFHDGSCDTLFRFHGTILFAPRPAGTISPNDPGNSEGFPLSAQGILERKQMEQFMLAFDSNLAPIVGQQVTLARGNSAAALPRIELMTARADAGDCEVVAHILGEGFLYVGGGKFRSGRHSHVKVPLAVLIALSKSRLGEVTFTCVPPGSGERIAGDRDEGNDD